MPFKVEDVRQEYEESALAEEEHDKVKWASPENMRNRIELALSQLPFDTVNSWLDVGCGSGLLQLLVRARRPDLVAAAVDLSPRLLDYARSRPGNEGVRFFLSDFSKFDNGRFDLITCIGVLQKSNLTPEIFFTRASRLLNPGGMVYVDTKHVGWRRFRKPSFFPESGLDWFSLDQLAQAVSGAGLTLEKTAGFLPAQAEIVPPEDSHNLFLIAVKHIEL